MFLPTWQRADSLLSTRQDWAASEALGQYTYVIQQMLLAKRAWKFPRTPLKLPISVLHVRKSMCHLTRLEYDSAAIEAQTALKFKPPERTQLQAHIALALCFSAQGQYAQAHQTLEASLAPATSSDLDKQYATRYPSPAPPEDEEGCKRAKESLPLSSPPPHKRDPDPLHLSAAAPSLSQPTGGGGGGGGGFIQSKNSEGGAEVRTGDVEGGGVGSGEGCVGGVGGAGRGTDVRRQIRVVMRLLYHTAKVSKETW